MLVPVRMFRVLRLGVGVSDSVIVFQLSLSVVVVVG